MCAWRGLWGAYPRHCPGLHRFQLRLGSGGLRHDSPRRPEPTEPARPLGVLATAVRRLRAVDRRLERVCGCGGNADTGDPLWLGAGHCPCCSSPRFRALSRRQAGGRLLAERRARRPCGQVGFARVRRVRRRTRRVTDARGDEPGRRPSLALTAPKSTVQTLSFSPHCAFVTYDSVDAEHPERGTVRARTTDGPSARKLTGTAQRPAWRPDPALLIGESVVPARQILWPAGRRVWIAHLALRQGPR